MITVLKVNGENLIIDYELDVQAIYFGDLESEFIEIEINSVTWETEYVDIDGKTETLEVDVLPIIQAMEQVESLKIILRDIIEDES